MKGGLSVLPPPPTPHRILIGGGSGVQVGAGEHGEEAAGRCSQQSLLCACVRPKPFHDRRTEEEQFAWGASVAAVSGICEPLSRRPAAMKAVSVGTAKAQQLSSSGVDTEKPRHMGQPASPFNPRSPTDWGMKGVAAADWIAGAGEGIIPQDTLLLAAGDTWGGMVGWR